ncbi:MAG: ribonuclease Y [Eubacteriaceae bacterium]|nr:ribonuclease Y [Eubacteriaceae bacterium]MBQ1466571.1 ribonuclease Y [Eubacteriaceae bacterium]MCR4894304.1 ribonuclease Y [Eubacteriales bacterium]
MGPLAYVLIIIALGAGIGLGIVLANNSGKGKVAEARQQAAQIVNDAVNESERIKKDRIADAKEEIYGLRKDLDKEMHDRRNEVKRLEDRIMQKEEAIDKKMDQIEKRDENSQRKAREIENKEEKINKLYQQQINELEKISQLTFEDARQILLDETEKQISRETALLIKNKEAEAKEEADKKAKEIITYAIQRCAADHVAESTVSVVNLPSDEMKGRIIGREGRNIRALETLTGIDLIIDDTPEAVILSGFDPVRREIARISLERLIVDGRIHPARIEETVKKAEAEVDQKMRELGEHAVFEANIGKIHPELVKLIGRLNYRTSYGQNVLKHSLEVSILAGIMADELGFNGRIARRAGLLHDIGKAIDHEVEGPHVQLGVDLLKKYKENSDVIHAVEAHHGDVEPHTVEAVLIQAADAISAARPGARRETLESYTRRLEKLEELVKSFDGIDKCYAISAGREVRIMVKPEVVDDLKMVHIARDIAKQIENDLEYPGQIKVNVIRETRATEYAK